ncbi:MAG TPA: ABC transporter ATP-binding protein [Amaricoccus sp.]|uniref:ABC transporter ATP-binding protein n=1 Tax=Amaricoccus sp. TaxID=1872485 RepID=UPI002CAC104F|nr:ABC transporter ATP-binding protein [Amaricoccus sp.]HMQ92291.1 ABC transporter ATP-binding protein [Amaricoccus sp.]HMR51042.1 ABC transporter ATP-binding protein [Amaricoccus sp.]HMR61331.1 ABC transporter ATP-binding protein [Amaricoccus sp.]HMT97779.1 ABC transporter ATP-binding protein [Amaricoccus sp.]
MTLLSIEGLTVLRGRCPAVDAVSVSIAPGEVVGLIGPNGAGKTTLMRGALGLLPHRGRSSLAELPPAARARHAAWLPQAREIAWPVTVGTVVALGRMPYEARGAAADAVAVTRAIDRMDLGAFRDRIATQLSGGEQARVLLARALAQETPLLLADEPIAGLDPAHQIATMDVFKDLAAAGRSVVVSLHDLGLAARFCSRLVMMRAGRIVADGAPAEILSPERLADVFGITVWREAAPEGLLLLPIARAGAGR